MTEWKLCLLLTGGCTSTTYHSPNSNWINSIFFCTHDALTLSESEIVVAPQITYNETSYQSYFNMIYCSRTFKQATCREYSPANTAFRSCFVDFGEVHPQTGTFMAVCHILSVLLTAVLLSWHISEKKWIRVFPKMSTCSFFNIILFFFIYLSFSRPITLGGLSSVGES